MRQRRARGGNPVAGPINYVTTGSRVYGVHKLESDLDLAMLTPDCKRIRKGLEAKGFKIEQTEAQGRYGDDGGFYFNLFGIKFNIISVGDDCDLEAWADATKEMLSADPIEDKKERSIVFRNIFNESLEAILPS